MLVAMSGIGFDIFGYVNALPGNPREALSHYEFENGFFYNSMYCKY